MGKLFGPFTQLQNDKFRRLICSKSHGLLTAQDPSVAWSRSCRGFKVPSTGRGSCSRKLDREQRTCLPEGNYFVAQRNPSRPDVSSEGLRREFNSIMVYETLLLFFLCTNSMDFYSSLDSQSLSTSTARLYCRWLNCRPKR